MLEPELLQRLALDPAKNAPDVNLALAEQGDGKVLFALARSDATPTEALSTLVQRISERGPAIMASVATSPDGEVDPEQVNVQLRELYAAVLAHPKASPSDRDAILRGFMVDPFFVLAACSHPDATEFSLEQAARWPAAGLAHDRRWIQLIPRTALSPILAETWAQDPDPLLREVVATLSADEGVLAAFLSDPCRPVRRALASNLAAGALRQQMAKDDPAVDVRRRAQSSLTDHGSNASRGSGAMRATLSARFAAGLRALESRGVLAPDTSAALCTVAHDSHDHEGARLATTELPATAAIEVLEAAISPAAAAVIESGAALGMAFRPRLNDGDADYHRVLVETVKLLARRANVYAPLTGKARLAAWVASGVAASASTSAIELLTCACDCLLTHPIVFRRMAASRSDFGAEALAGMAAPSMAAIEWAWHDPRIADEVVERIAEQWVKSKRKAKAILELDPNARPLALLEKVVLPLSRSVTIGPRAALAAVALDSRRVRYVLTALPQWRGGLDAVRLSRVLRQRAGAIRAGGTESRPTGSEDKSWTQRIMSDAEVAVALGIGHLRADSFAARLDAGHHKLEDGVGVAAALDARAVVGGVDSIRPLLKWATRNRSQSGAALSMWLLLAHHDRPRASSVIASAVDSLASNTKVMPACVVPALAALERRAPGRLEQVFASTPRGKAAVAGGIARAYNDVGGTRDAV